MLLMKSVLIIIIRICLAIDCEKYLASDCQDIIHSGLMASGVYNITPLGTYGAIDVYCDMETDGGGWLVFQRREDGSVNFYRGDTDYYQGFGNISGEHWLGHHALYSILLQGHYELRIDLADWENNTAFAKYWYFKLADPTESYKLIIAEYSGNAGDSLSLAKGRAFTTKDDPGCSRTYKGAWWYQGCIDSNLNGPYVAMDKLTDSLPKGHGLIWYTWKGYQYSMKRTEMKVRRVII